MHKIAMVLLMGGLLLGASRCDKDDPAGNNGGPLEGDGSAGGEQEEPGQAGSNGSGGEKCGSKTCPAGQECCNESCGICVEPGGFCTEQFCGDPTDPPPSSAPSCGGIAGRPCPGEGSCVDDPSDSCDPRNGGADCGGICKCRANRSCSDGHWNASPEVCACEADGGEGGASQAGTGGDEAGQGGSSGGGEECGPNVCAAGQECCNESCGICTPPGGGCTKQFCVDAGVDPDPDPEPPPFCGGFAGFPCPGSGECVDDPSDDCDPQNGGADCGGICECPPSIAAVVLCEQGSQWDPSPGVCGCAPVKGMDPVGDVCGKNICPSGQVCCNASCGICAPPDGACIQIACL